jgi:predicted CopG family antitoxin
VAVKTITIDMEAYNILKNEKKQGESFSQVIKRRLRKNSTAHNLLRNLKTFSLSEKTLSHVDELINDRDTSLINSEIIE